MATALLTTKLYVPHPRHELVTRDRLIKRLEDALNGRLTLISAPAGSGKTTLVSDFVRRIARPTAWI